MKMFVVQGGVAVVEAGAVVKMTRSQFDARAHAVEVLQDNGELVLARALTSLQFKVGEQIGLEALPRYLSLFKDGFAHTLEMRHQGATPVVEVAVETPLRADGRLRERAVPRQSR
ncbi:hypothetical protein [Pseudorhodoplanes sp.]|uniref:hypothetical protein n=1 Tax=Pseudorhodoplanes sp. TaxID=1934341 RepID=UPI003D0A7251